MNASEIILNYVCPVLGVILTNAIGISPLKDLQRAVAQGEGLNDLNPTPWVFQLGNCLGWTVYAILANDWYIFCADFPGFIIAVWLNMGAVKLLYLSHHQEETRYSIANFLAKNEQNL